MAHGGYVFLAGSVLTLLLQGCVQTPTEPVDATPAAEEPEITLNLPSEQACDCTQPVVADYTFLEKGFSSLSRGEHTDAMEYFERYQRMESSPEADWEAAVAIAFTHSLADSSLYDPETARKSYRDLRKVNWRDMELHEQTLLMRLSLETFLAMERRVRDLSEDNSELQEDLEKREEALKRLRELTLGQKGSTQ